MACELVSEEFVNSKGEKILFATRQLSAKDALDLQVELVGKLGNSVFPFIDGHYNFGDLIAFMSRADNKIISELMVRVVCKVVKEGQEIKPATINYHFDGELMLLCKVFAFVLEANFKAFFKQGLEMNVQFKLAEEERLKLEELKSTPAPQTTLPENSPT